MKIAPAKMARLLDVLGLAEEPRGNVVVMCPLHKDTDESLSVHFGKGVYHCFGCGEKGRLADFPLDVTPAVKPERPPLLSEQVTVPAVKAAAKEMLVRRKLKIPGAAPVVDKASPLYGYLAIPSFEEKDIVCRRLFPGPAKYRAVGAKNTLFWASSTPRAGDAVWLVEGPLDAYALKHAGATHVAAVLGEIPDPVKKQAQVDRLLWPLRDRFVILFMDNDSAGWREGKRLAEALREREIPYEVIRRSDVMRDGEDPCDVWERRPKELIAFVHAVERRHTGDEQVYVERWLTDEDELLSLSSGLPGFDKIHSGGLAPGVHIFQGDTGIGKSQLMIYLTRRAAAAGMKTLMVSTELPKRQIWARYASTLPEAPAWRDIERAPKKLAKKFHRGLLELTRSIRVQKGIPLARAMQLMQGRQVLVLDYIQRLPGVMGEDEAMATMRIGQAIGALADHAMEHGYLALVVSSLPNSALANPGATSGKYSGDIGFNAQSVTSIIPRGDVVELEVCKNTRGALGTSVVRVDKSRCAFKETGRVVETDKDGDGKTRRRAARGQG